MPSIKLNFKNLYYQSGRSRFVNPEAIGQDSGVDLAGEVTSRPLGKWLVGFVVISLVFQIGLFFLGASPILRLPLRVGVYGVSLAFLALIRGEFQRAHPALLWSKVAIAILLIELLNAAGDGLLARIATIAIYSSVLAPLFWIGRLRVSMREFRIVVLLMWAFYTASSLMGNLQANFPGRFDGALSSALDDQALVRNYIHTGDGTRILRPSGLTDTPGAASTSGVNSIILGAGLLLTETSLAFRGVIVAGMMVALSTIYICYVRVNLIVAALSVMILLVLLILRKDIKRTMIMSLVIASVVMVGTAAAFVVGGEAVMSRFYTLVADDAGTVFQENRGSFLNELISDDVLKYPLGAGEGRCGLANAYFGSAGRGLYAEMLWQCLVFDGGIPLMAVYIGLFASLMWSAFRLAITSRSETVGCWAAMVLGYNVAVVAASFVYPIMLMQTGLELVLLNAALYGATRHLGSMSATPRLMQKENRQPSALPMLT